MHCAIEHHFIHILVWLCFAVAVDVFHLHRGIVHKDAHRQRQPAERHDIDGLAGDTEHNDRSKNGKRNRSRNDERASPVTQKDQNHQSRQTRSDDRFPDHAADRSQNEDGLVSQGLHL